MVTRNRINHFENWKIKFFVEILFVFLNLQVSQTAVAQSTNCFEHNYISPICGRQVFHRISGSFKLVKTPGPPGRIPKVVECTWKIITPYPERVLNISFSNFTLEDSSDCSHDYIEIYDGQTRIGKRSCGSGPPSNIISPGSGVTVRFYTDGIYNATKLKINWLSVEKPTAGLKRTSTVDLTRASSIPYKECGGHFYGVFGSISSPGFPNPYAHKVDCFWTISSLPGYALDISFKNFSLEGGDGCTFDYVQLLDDYDQTGTCYCGTALPDNRTLSGNAASITFHSDDLLSSTGFVLRWNSHDIDECALKGCGANAKCHNTDGSYRCPCYHGFSWNGKACQDINECEYEPCDTNEVCINAPGNYTCSCKTGYSKVGSSCEDINECISNLCPDNSNCVNILGSFSCTCNTGYYEQDGNCTDVNECSTRPCHINATCRNINGSYRCSCNIGHIGNGTICTELIPETITATTTVATTAATTAATATATSTATVTASEVLSTVTVSTVSQCEDKICAENAACFLSRDTDEEICQCNEGFTGVGDTYCTAICRSSSLHIDGLKFTFNDSLPKLMAHSEEKCAGGFSKASVLCETSTVNNRFEARFSLKTLTYTNCSHSDVSSYLSEVDLASLSSSSELNLFLSTLTLMTSNPDDITNEQAILIVKVLADISKYSSELEISPFVFEKVLTIGDHVTGTVGSLPDPNDRTGTSESLINSLTTLGQKLNLSPTESSFDYLTSNLAAKVQDQEETSTLEPFEPSVYEGKNGKVVQPVSIHIPKEALAKARRQQQDNILRKKRDVRNSTAVRVVFFAHRSSQLFPSDQSAKWVICAEVGNETITNLVEPVSYTYLRGNTSAGKKPHTDPLKSTYVNQSCVFWNFTLQDWSSEGCCLVNGSNPPECRCNHLTNFAVLLSIYEVREDIALSIASKVGCIISIVSLFLSVLLQYVPKQIRTRRPIIVLNHICLNMGLAFIVFVCGIDKRDRVIGCLVSTILLHYFLLCTWCWMAVYAHVLYKSLVQVFNVTWHRYFTKSAVMSYGIPLIVVAVNAIVTLKLPRKTAVVKPLVCGEDTTEEPVELDVSSILADNVCWLKGHSLHFSFLLPVGIILIVNVVIFSLVLREIQRSQKLESSIPKRTTKQHLLVAVTIATTLGLVWLSGYCLLLSDNLVYFTIVSWIFTIVASLQGLCIFLLLCVRNREVRELWWPQLVRFFFLPCTVCRACQYGGSRRGSIPTDTMTTDASKLKGASSQMSKTTFRYVAPDSLKTV